MSIKNKIPIVFTSIVLIILITFSATHYIRWESKVIEEYETEIEIISNKIADQIQYSKEASLFIEDIIGRELRTASVAISKSLPSTYEEIDNDTLSALADELMVSHITLFAKTEDDIVGVRSTDHHQIGLSTNEWGYWHKAFQQLMAKEDVTVEEGMTLSNYWTGPIEIASSNPEHTDKWGYYYDGTTDYLINPYFRDEKIHDFEQAFGPERAIDRLLDTYPGLLELTVFNPKNFGMVEEAISLNGNTYVRLSEQPIWYGKYNIHNVDKDRDHIMNAIKTGMSTSYREILQETEVIKTFVPVLAEDNSRYVVGISYDYDYIDAQLKEELNDHILMSLLFIFLVVGISFSVSRSLSKPISDIAETVNEIAKGNFLKQVTVSRKDELGGLAKDVNQLSKSLKKYTEDLEESKGIIHYQAYHDPLTSLPNRRFVKERLDILEQVYEEKGLPFALLFIDLDRFKHVNDSLGHAKGDELISLMAKRILKCFSNENELVARQGGDEFIVLIDNASTEIVEEKVTRLLEKLQVPVFLDDHEIYIKASIGISMYPNHTKDVNLLVSYADLAMYESKSQGGNKYTFYHQKIKDITDERLLIEARLRKAIVNDSIDVYYQPKVDGYTNRIIGAEALVRWNDEVLGFVSPVNFIPVAEEVGLIDPIWEIVMRKACKQVVQWNKLVKEPMTVAVNFSSNQFSEPAKMVQRVKEILTEYDVKPEWFHIEITESILLYNTNTTIKALAELKEYGIQISVDDFGTGYSSLSYLKSFPINTLKIDKSFIQDIDQNHQNTEIAEAIINLAKTLQLDIIAEGVETSYQKDFLIEHRCTEMQGFYFSKPIPAKQFQDNLNQLVS
ncbi:EAL domain-containing protein [Bacillus alkalicellulosilyticus]|uniref:bifunctional diguanylate cyclase/phosphodiesterase n=1 Tax=Alkalihalobacterium alkalicellulosilyticum TaxID=1912214 RepID=UPI000998A4DA|nr:EAL domain-containing protein [Bacillus alkalicellulosilyticus]